MKNLARLVVVAAAVFAIAACGGVISDVPIQLAASGPVTATTTALEAKLQIDPTSAGSVYTSNKSLIGGVVVNDLVVAVDGVTVGGGAVLSNGTVTISDGTSSYSYFATAAPSPITVIAGKRYTLMGFTPVQGGKSIDDVVTAYLQTGTTFFLSLNGTLSAPVAADLTVTLDAGLKVGL